MLISQGWLYHIIIYLYTLSILFYFADFLNSNRQANRVAFWLLAVVWGLQSVFFIHRMTIHPYFPVMTLFESLFFYSWILVTLSLIINYFFKIDFFVFFTNIIGFTLLSLNLFVDPDAPVQVTEMLTSNLLVIHITMAFLSYGAFSLSFIFSVMYLIQDKLLKEKKWNHKLRRLPSLEQLDRYAYRFNIIGVPVLLLSLILGLIWAWLKIGGWFWVDIKVLMSVLVLMMFSVYLYQRVVTGKRGRGLVLWNVGAFLFMIVNFLLSDSVSSFHRWF